LNENEFDNTLRRIFLLVKSQAEESIIALPKKNAAFMMQIIEVHETIERLVNYSLRLLSKPSNVYQDKSQFYYHLVYCLGNLSEVYTYILKESLRDSRNYSSLSILLFKEVNSFFITFYHYFYNRNHDASLALAESRNIIFDKINLLTKSSQKDDVILLGRLSIIVLTVFDLVETSISLDF